MNYKFIKFKFVFVKYITLIMFIVFICMLLFLANGFIEKKPVDIVLTNFKSRAVYEETIIYNKQTVNIHKVTPIYDYEDVELQTFTKDSNGDYYIGSELDIILTNRNPLRTEPLAIVRDIGKFFSKEFYIGHATINTTKDGKMIIESVGNVDDYYGVREIENNWLKTEINFENDAQTIVGLRVKGLSNDKKNDIIESLRNKVGLRYNMNFIIPKKNAYYCTDLITRTFKEHGIKLDYDGFYPTGSDIIISENTYPIFICEKVENEIFNIYYMGE